MLAGAGLAAGGAGVFVPCRFERVFRLSVCLLGFFFFVSTGVRLFYRAAGFSDLFLLGGAGGTLFFTFFGPSTWLGLMACHGRRLVAVIVCLAEDERVIRYDVVLVRVTRGQVRVALLNDVLVDCVGVRILMIRARATNGTVRHLPINVVNEDDSVCAVTTGQLVAVNVLSRRQQCVIMARAREGREN